MKPERAQAFAEQIASTLMDIELSPTKPSPRGDHRYRLAVMLAHAAGAETQCWCGDTGRWEDSPDPTWNWLNSTYRVKPQPKPPVHREMRMEEFPANLWLRQGRTMRLRRDRKGTRLLWVLFR